RFEIINAGNTTSCAYKGQGMPAQELNYCFPGGYTFAGNAIIAGTLHLPISGWPGGNYFPATTSAVQFVNINGGDYHLLPASPYKNAGSGGKDLGADIDAVLAATANAY